MKVNKIEIFKIIGLALLSAVVFNSFSSNTVEYIYSAQQHGEDKQTVSLEEAKMLFDEKKIVFLDARPLAIYKRGHIPGAVSLPYNSDEKEKLMTDSAKDDSLVVYCYSSRCNQARALQIDLEKLGYTNVFVFDGGVQEWTKANYPMESKISNEKVN